MKRSMTIIAAALMAIVLSSCAPAIASEERADVGFKYVHDWAEPKVPSGATRILEEQQEAAAQAAEEIEAIAEEAYYEEYYDYGYTGGYVGYRGDPDGLNNFNGTYEYNGRTESFYSGQAVYTNDLTVDGDGFYRDDEGRYAVATNSGDYAIGDTFEGSMGTCVVVDDGASEGVTDYYVSGWY